MSTSEEVLKTASHLEESSKEVGESSQPVAVSIQEVAIGAAQAGSAGRWFSAVADEIRDLAEESSSSDDKIKKLIDKVTKKVVGDEM